MVPEGYKLVPEGYKHTRSGIELPGQLKTIESAPNHEKTKTNKTRTPTQLARLVSKT